MKRRCHWRGSRFDGPRCEEAALYSVVIGQYAGRWCVCEKHMHKLVDLETPRLGNMVMRIDYRGFEWKRDTSVAVIRSKGAVQP